MGRVLPKKSKLMIAFRGCFHLGGTPGLPNLRDRETIFQTAYRDSPSSVNPEGITPQPRHRVDGFELTLPGFFDTVRALDQVVEVDYYIPGCAPTPKIILAAVQTLLSGQLPPRGAG